jgi:hypothetical protein
MLKFHVNERVEPSHYYIHTTKGTLIQATVNAELNK